MYSCIKKDYIVVDNCILGYLGEDSALAIPESLDDGQIITRIGKGALGTKNQLMAIVFPDSITSFEDSVFVGTDNVKYIEVPISLQHVSDKAFTGFKCAGLCLRMSEDTLKSFKNYMNLGDEQESLLSPSLIGVCRKIIDGMYDGYLRGNGKGYAARSATVQFGDLTDYEINENMNWIFRDDHPDSNIFTNTEGRQKSVFARSGLYNLSEMEAVLKLIAHNYEIYENVDSEMSGEWDKKIKKNKSELPEVVLLRASVGESVLADVPVLKIRTEIGRFFFPSVKRIVIDKEYWIYRRCYLAKGGYITRDIAVLDRNGIVEDPDIKTRVYGKYKLLTIM